MFVKQSQKEPMVMNIILNRFRLALTSTGRRPWTHTELSRSTRPSGTYMTNTPTTPIGRPEIGRSFARAGWTLACVFASAAAAGEDVSTTQALAAGQRVRIVSADISPNQVVGTIVRVDDKSLTLGVPGRAGPVTVERDRISRLEVSMGLRSRWTDAVIGGLIGGAGLALACSAGTRKNSIVGSSGVAGTCGAVGLSVGALVGAAIPPGERWSEVAATRYRVGFVPRPDHGAGLMVAWGF
jgi:hypothetical protein